MVLLPKYLLAAGLAIILGYLPSAAFGSLAGQVLQVASGPVLGFPAFSSAPSTNITNWQDVAVWKGIPYAASTAGANRWRAPQARTPWNTTLVADRFGAGCPATPGQSPSVDEDCLNLNIWSAANNGNNNNTTSGGLLPVMLWTHPAGGSGADPLFDGGGMAAQGVVFVNYNHRDGAFGWLALPELSHDFNEETAGTSKNSSGNWALLDQFAALRWVHANIAAFGGDPSRITVVGQSAGSATVYHMVNSPLLPKGMIRAAIAESGIRDPRDPLAASLAESYNNQSYALSLGAAFLQANNASSLAALRDIPLASLKGTQSFPGSGGGFRPTLDYYAIPDTYARTLAKGPPLAHDVPLMTGNTRDESGAAFGLTITVAQYTAAMQQQYGEFNLTARALAAYPVANNASAAAAGAAYNAHWRDTSLVSSWGFARGWTVAAKAQSPIYTYYWDHAPPGQTQGAHHMSEINYVFNNLYKTTNLPWQAEDYAIARRMSAYWANFAKTGNPNRGESYSGNGTTLVTWRPTVANETLVMHVGDGWGDMPIAGPEQISLITDYFQEQTPF